MGEIDHHERKEQQPQSAGAVSGGEVAPHVGLGDRLAPGTGGSGAGPFDVLGAPEHRRRVVAGDPHRARIVEHLLGRRTAHPVDQKLQRGALRPARRGTFLHMFHCVALPP